MRRSLGRPLAAAASVLAFAFATGAISEEAEFEDVQVDGSQIMAVGGSSDGQARKNLNTVPVDGLELRNSLGPNNRLVRQLQAAHPNEDLVICIAGCFSDRDRVVYARPIDLATRARPTILPGQSSANDPVKPVEKKTAQAEAAHSGAPASQGPYSATILNGGSDGTSGFATAN